MYDYRSVPAGHPKIDPEQATQGKPMDERVKWWAKEIATVLERILALAILVGILVFAVQSVTALTPMPWSSVETFYELIYRILLLVIGVELIRTLVTHDLNAILELLAFVVARKMLKPDITVLDIFLGVLAFIALLAAGRFLLPRLASEPARRRGSEHE
jgi:uncharacterized membrane protein (DUF373 family)